MTANINELFYQYGYTNLNYVDIETVSKFNNKISKLISDESSWKRKYKFSKDLKHEVLKNEDIFYDFIFNNNFHDQINKITSQKLILTNVQVRVCYRGLSYMTWHRDTYISKNKVIGPFKPCFKLMVYPNLFNKKLREISVIPNSHSRLDFNFTHKYLSSFNYKTKHINNDNNRCLFIDTTILHKAVSSINNLPRPRIIYNFSTEETMKEFYKSDINQFYINKYKNYQN